MLTVEEIKTFLLEDESSLLKKAAKVGWNYYEGKHDILDYRMFYWNNDGNLVEDKTRSNAKIPHQFFTELVDQATEFVLSGNDDGIIMSKDELLQKELDTYFNKNTKFISELSETITGMQAKGFDYMYAYKGKNDRLAFENADCLGVVEVEGRFAEDKKDQRIYKYVDRIDREGKTQWKILVVDDENTYYYKQTDNGEIEMDSDVEMNPKPHAVYEKDGKLYKKDDYHILPFFRLDNNKKRKSFLPAVKPLIDDYDIHASSLTNNLIDFDTPLHVVKGFEGDDLSKLQQNLKTKKLIGVDEEGGVEVHTVDIPYQARKEKLDLDEKNIYRFGMGLNMQGLKDTTATTNIAIKAMFALLELRCKKIIKQLKLFLLELVEAVIAEINDREGTDYSLDDVYFDFTPEVMSNEQENAAIKLTEAQTKQAEVNILLGLATMLDNETIVKNICEILDIDYEEIKSKLPDPNEAESAVKDAQGALDSVPVEPEAGEGNEEV